MWNFEVFFVVGHVGDLITDPCEINILLLYHTDDSAKILMRTTY